MAGILMREGVSRGHAPTVELLSLGARNPTRHPSDLLPYLPRFRQFFAKLPTEVAEMELKVLKIPLGDVEAVIGTTVKVRGPVWLLHIKKGIDNHSQTRPDDLLKHREEQKKLAEGEIAKICSSWDQPQWDELDWSRIKELTTRDILEHRKKEAVTAQQSYALECLNFVKHVSEYNH